MGSTNLMNVFNALPNIKVFSEPFNVALHNIACDVNNDTYIQRRLTEVFDEHNGIKHCWGQLSREKNVSLLHLATKQHGAKLIFLHRGNTIQRAVSLMLSQQSGVWHKHDGQEVGLFKPIDLDMLRRMVQHEDTSVPFYRECFSQMLIQHHEILYEDLFDPKKSLEDKCCIIDHALQFLGFALSITPYHTKASSYLDVDKKLSDEMRYKRIPNLGEIMTAFNVNECLETSG